MIVSFTIWCSSQLCQRISPVLYCSIVGNTLPLFVGRLFIPTPTPRLGLFLMGTMAQPHVDNAHYQQKFKSCVVVVPHMLFLSYFPEEAAPSGWIPEGKQCGGELSQLTKKHGMHSIACHWRLLLFNAVARLPKNV